jgi:hypothetical protein
MDGGVEVRELCVQVNFLLEIEGGEARVSVEEHSVAVGLMRRTLRGWRWRRNERVG